MGVHPDGMNMRTAGRIVAAAAMLAFSSPLSAQETNRAPGVEMLRNRLEQLQKELAAEETSLAGFLEATRQESLARTEERRKRAGQLLDRQMELERLKKRRRDLERETAELGTDSGKWRTILSGLLAGARTTAERIDIYLRETPGADVDLCRNVESVADGLPSNVDELNTETFRSHVRTLLEAMGELCRESAGIGVRPARIHTARGQLEEVKMLSAGHIAFAYETVEGRRVGLALSSPADASGYRWTETLAGESRRAVARTIRQIESGSAAEVTVPVDVTQGLRVDARLHEETLMERLRSGGPVMWPLAGVAALGLLIIIERMRRLYWLNPDTAELVDCMLAACRAGNYGEAERLVGHETGVVPRTLAECLRRRAQGVRAMEDGIQERLLHELPLLRRFLAGLAVLAGVAPLLGLLGTVTGIIQTFGVIRVFGNANPGLMAGGISEALITTATGLVIAIPILLCRGLLRGRMEKIVGDAEKNAAALLNILAKDE